MEMKDICPCVRIDCPNHGNCENCTSRHLKRGSVNYCAFYTILPALQEAIGLSPESPTAQKIAFMVNTRLENYANLAAKNCLDKLEQERLLKQVADYSDY